MRLLIPGMLVNRMLLLFFPVAAWAQAPAQSSAPGVAPTRADLIGTWATAWRRGRSCDGRHDRRTAVQLSVVLGADGAFSDHCRVKTAGRDESTTGTVSQWHLAGDTLWLGDVVSQPTTIYRIILQDKQLTLFDVKDEQRTKPLNVYTLLDTTSASSATEPPPPPVASAQAAMQAAESIAAADVARHMAVLSQDSMQGRGTPSPALERAARYVAAQFQQLGLEPGNDGWNADWLQRYPIPGQLRVDPAASGLRLSTTVAAAGRPVVDERGQQPGRQTFVSFAAAARPLGAVLPRFDSEDRRRVLLVSGRQTAASLRQAKVQGAIVFYLPPAAADSALRQSVVRELSATNQGVILLRTADSTGFAADVETARRHPVRLADRFMATEATGRWSAEIWASALQGVLVAAGVDLAAVQADTAPRVRELASMQVELSAQSGATPIDTVTAPNVFALLAGTDSVLGNQYIVFTAHLDQPDGVVRGADDNASGVAGLLALAKAFSRPGARPRRSLAFVVTSGGRKGGWGASAFLTQPLPGRIAFDVTLDMIGRMTGDSVAVDGVQDLVFAEPPAWVAAAHPELQLTVADTGTAFQPVSDHFPFVQLGLPALYVHHGVHADSARQAPEVADDVVAARTARVARLVYYLSQKLANAEQLPRWSVVGRRHLLAEGLGTPP